MGLMRKIIYTRRTRADPQPAFQGAWGVYRVAVYGFLCTCGAIGVFSHAPLQRLWYLKSGLPCDFLGRTNKYSEPRRGST